MVKMASECLRKQNYQPVAMVSGAGGASFRLRARVSGSGREFPAPGASGLLLELSELRCRSKVQMSGLGKVEMSGSRYVTGHVGPGPDHEQTRVRARSFAT